MSPSAIEDGRRETARSAKLPASLGLGLLAAYFVLHATWLAPTEAEFAYAPWHPRVHLFAPMRGFTFEQLADHALRALVLGPALLLLTIALTRSRLHVDWGALWSRRVHVPAAVLSVAATTFTMLVLVRGRPIVDDEVTYASMARSLLRGRLADPPIPGFNLTLFEVPTALGITGKYLPGEALVQTVGLWVGVPPILHIAANALTLFCFHRALVLMTADERIASWSTAFLGLSPMFILCAATGHSQATAFACTAASMLGYALADKRGLVRGALLSGLSVALGMLVRPQALPVVGVVLAISYTGLAVRRGAWGRWLVFGVTSALGVAAIAGYDYLLAGNKLEFPFTFMRATERWGFGPIGGPGSYEHTLRGALANQAVVFVRMNSWWLGWPLSFLLLAFPGGLREVFRHAPVVLGIALSVLLFQFGYYTTGVSDVGPLYHYEVLPLLATWLSYSISKLARERPRLVGALLAVHLGLGTGTYLVQQASRLHRLVEAIHHEADRVLASLPPRSLLLTETWCSEILTAGWLLRGYPQQVVDDRAKVVIHSRPEPAQLASVQAHFADRSCFYVHGVAEKRALEVLPCAEAMPLLLRPLGGGPGCYMPLSTAQRLGLYTPDLGF